MKFVGLMISASCIGLATSDQHLRSHGKGQIGDYMYATRERSASPPRFLRPKNESKKPKTSKVAKVTGISTAVATKKTTKTKAVQSVKDTATPLTEDPVWTFNEDDLKQWECRSGNNNGYTVCRLDEATGAIIQLCVRKEDFNMEFNRNIALPGRCTDDGQEVLMLEGVMSTNVRDISLLLTTDGKAIESLQHFVQEVRSRIPEQIGLEPTDEEIIKALMLDDNDIDYDLTSTNQRMLSDKHFSSHSSTFPGYMILANVVPDKSTGTSRALLDMDCIIQLIDILSYLLPAILGAFLPLDAWLETIGKKTREFLKARLDGKVGENLVQVAMKFARLAQKLSVHSNMGFNGLYKVASDFIGVIMETLKTITLQGMKDIIKSSLSSLKDWLSIALDVAIEITALLLTGGYKKAFDIIKAISDLATFALDVAKFNVDGCPKKIGTSGLVHESLAICSDGINRSLCRDCKNTLPKGRPPLPVGTLVGENEEQFSCPVANEQCCPPVPWKCMASNAAVGSCECGNTLPWEENILLNTMVGPCEKCCVKDIGCLANDQVTEGRCLTSREKCNQYGYALASFTGGILALASENSVCDKCCVSQVTCNYKNPTTAEVISGVCIDSAAVACSMVLVSSAECDALGNTDAKCCLNQQPSCSAKESSTLRGKCFDPSDSRISCKLPTATYDCIEEQMCCIDNAPSSDLQCSTLDYQGECMDETLCGELGGVTGTSLCPSFPQRHIKCCLPSQIDTCVIKGSFGEFVGHCKKQSDCLSQSLTPLGQGGCAAGDSCCVDPPSCSSGSSDYWVGGSCMHNSTCVSFGGQPISGQGCAGDEFIQCCIPSMSCSKNGVTGTCTDKDRCTTNSGRTFPGFGCYGSNEVQCCLDEEMPSCMVGIGTWGGESGMVGQCTWDSDCTDGLHIPSADCPGDGTVKCCIPKESTITCEVWNSGILENEGVCIPTSDCNTSTASVVKGKCPAGAKGDMGATDVECCVPIQTQPSCADNEIFVEWDIEVDDHDYQWFLIKRGEKEQVVEDVGTELFRLDKSTGSVCLPRNGCYFFFFEDLFVFPWAGFGFDFDKYPNAHALLTADGEVVARYDKDNGSWPQYPDVPDEIAQLIGGIAGFGDTCSNDPANICTDMGGICVDTEADCDGTTPYPLLGTLACPGRPISLAWCCMPAIECTARSVANGFCMRPSDCPEDSTTASSYSDDCPFSEWGNIECCHSRPTILCASESGEPGYCEDAFDCNDPEMGGNPSFGWNLDEDTSRTCWDSGHLICCYEPFVQCEGPNGEIGRCEEQQDCSDSGDKNWDESSSVCEGSSGCCYKSYDPPTPCLGPNAEPGICLSSDAYCHLGEWDESLCDGDQSGCCYTSNTHVPLSVPTLTRSPLSFYTVGQCQNIRGYPDDNHITFLVTEEAMWQTGGAWSVESYRVDVKHSFEFHFAANFGSNINGGDGIVFAIQNDRYNALETTGGHFLGYGYKTGNSSSIAASVDKSVGIEFDTSKYPNTTDDPVYGEDRNEIEQDHIAILTNGNILSPLAGGPVQAKEGQTNLKDGAWHDIWVEYKVETGLFSVYFDDRSLARINTTINIQSIVGTDMAYWGFTASTGRVVNRQQVTVHESSYLMYL